MLRTWILGLVSVGIVSLLSLIGVVTLVLRQGALRQILPLLVSFAVGGLLGDAFIHLLPEAFRTSGFGLATSGSAIGGILVFFVLEKFVRWRHCHEPDCEEHTKPLVVMNLVGDAAHNLIDGMLIGASYLVSVPIGIGASLAIILHEIPHELGNFGVLIHGGLSIRRALGWNFLSALVAVVGTVASFAVGPHLHGYTQVLLPVTAGGFIYVAGADLIPELHREVDHARSWLQLAAMLLGLGVMAALVALE
jgi:zinc and cadmium transporter